MSLSKIAKCALVAGVCVAGMSVYVQGAEAEVSASIGGKFGIGGSGDKSKVEATKEADKPKTPMDDISQRAGDLQEKVKTAVLMFQKANNASREERMSRLDQVISTIDNSLGEMGETGPLYKEIDKALKTTAETQKKYKDKALNPSLDAKMRERYEKLVAKLDVESNNLVNRRSVLRKACEDLDHRKKGLVQEKDFVIDLMAADDLKAANEALIAVIDTVKGVSEAIDKFAENMTTTPAAPADVKGAR